jgi:hypothetical protein
MDTHDYDVAPAGRFALLMPLLFAVLLGLGLVVLVASRYDQPRVLVGALPGLVALLAVFALAAWLVRHPLVRLRDGVLQVGRFPRLRAPAASFRLDAARIVELADERELQPTIRLVGTSLPGLHAGWFWLRDRSRAFLLVTDRRRVLVLPRHEGGPVLLSLVHPEALLDALRGARR